MPGKDFGKQKFSSAYQGAVEAVAALILSMGVGYWVDQRFALAPIGLLSGIALGFSAMVLRLVRMRPKVESTEKGDTQSGPRDET